MAFATYSLPLTRHLRHQLHLHRYHLTVIAPRRALPLHLAPALSSQQQLRDVTTAATSNQRQRPGDSTDNSSSSKRGFDLLRDDVQRISRFLRGDLSAITAKPLTLHRYDPVQISDYYDSRPFTVLIRLASIGVPFLLWAVRVRRLDRMLPLSRSEKVTRRRAAQLRRLLTWAGPTYLKIGQAISNRPDLVGAVYSAELQKLVDDVGAFDGQVAKQIIRDELGITDLEEVFSSFDADAVASASLGQVHRATLAAIGTKQPVDVAVKVQRPTVERDAALDVYVLRKFAAFAKQRFKLRSDIVGIVDEFATRLWEELDYINEANNCERFKTLYASDEVAAPAVYRQFTTRRVLVLQWVNGDKAPWSPLEDARRLVRIGVQCSLDQLLDKGFVHADPHAGNLLRSRYDGRLVYLDFGMCVEVPTQAREDLVAAIVRLVNRDFENIGDSFVKLGFLPPDADTASLTPLLVDAFGDASTGSSLSDLSFNRLANNLSTVAFKTPIRIPVFFTLIIRSLTILEGLALQADPSFKIVDEAYPYVVRRILADDSPVFRTALRDVLIDSKTNRLRWNRLSTLLSTRSSYDEDTGLNPSGEVAVARKEQNSSLDGMSNRALSRVIDFALSERGSFLRDALINEIVDTTDAVQLALQNRFAQATRGFIPPPMDTVDYERVENAINLAKVLRARVPELLDQTQNTGRLNAIRTQLGLVSRTIVGSIVERNSRRVLRRAIETVFGPKRRDSPDL